MNTPDITDDVLIVTDYEGNHWKPYIVCHYSTKNPRFGSSVEAEQAAKDLAEAIGQFGHPAERLPVSTLASEKWWLSHEGSHDGERTIQCASGTVARFDGGPNDDDRVLARARLATAAPELLAALEGLLKCVEAQPSWRDLTDRVDENGNPFPAAPWLSARAAIKKTKGTP